MLLKVGPHRTLAALFGEVRGSKGTGTLWELLGDPPQSLPHQYC